MSNYNYDFIVTRSEQEALKEMIFKRARERAEQLNKKTQAGYMDNVQNDIMELAHNSFTASKNPFSEKTTEEERAKQSLSYRNIGFSERKIKDIKERINNEKKQAETSAVDNNMKEARSEFENKKAFTGALDFLNSQASISLNYKKKATFEAIA